MQLYSLPKGTAGFLFDDSGTIKVLSTSRDLFLTTEDIACDPVKLANGIKQSGAPTDSFTKDAQLYASRGYMVFALPGRALGKRYGLAVKCSQVRPLVK